MKRVLVAGTCNQDLIDGVSYLGGSTAGIAINLSILGISTGVVSAIGQDEYGNKFIEEFQKRKIDISLLKTDAPKTPLFTMDTRAENPIGEYFPYGIDEILKSYSPGKDILNKFDILHASNISKEFGDYLADTFQGQISYSPNRKFVRDKTYISLQMVRKARYIFCNEEEYDIFKTVANTEELLKNNLEMLCITLGKDGLKMLTKNGEKSFQAEPIKKMMDPTGAGDALVTGFLLEIAKGNSIEEGIQFGLRLASLIIQQKGIIFPDNVANIV